MFATPRQRVPLPFSPAKHTSPSPHSAVGIQVAAWQISRWRVPLPVPLQRMLPSVSHGSPLGVSVSIEPPPSSRGLSVEPASSPPSAAAVEASKPASPTLTPLCLEIGVQAATQATRNPTAVRRVHPHASVRFIQPTSIPSVGGRLERHGGSEHRQRNAGRWRRSAFGGRTACQKRLGRH